MYHSLVTDSTAMKYRLQNYVDCTAVTDHVGVYAPDGKLNVTILEDEDTWTGLYAKNGSINVVEGSGLGVYSKCGAYNVIWTPSSLFSSGEQGGLYDPSDLSTVFQNATGTVPATAGSPVGQIKDKSGNGNHAVAPTDAARPTLARMPKTGRRNLLDDSEDMTRTWKRTQSTTFNKEGGITGFRENTALSQHFVYQRHEYPANRVISLEARYIQEGQPRFLGIESRVGSAFIRPFINLDTGEVVDAGPYTDITTTSLADGWMKIVAIVSGEAPADTNFALFASVGTHSSTLNYQGDGVSGLEFRNLQDEEGLTPTPYQKVTDAFDVTEAGVPDVWYLQGDGVDDALNATIPAGQYTRAFCNANGTVTFDEDISISGQENILRDNQLVGVIYAPRNLTTIEKQLLTQYWKDKSYE